jgi:hypothetical protein
VLTCPSDQVAKLRNRGATSCHGTDLACDHCHSTPLPLRLRRPPCHTSDPAYGLGLNPGPNPGSQTHPQDVCINVSSSWNLDIWTLLDLDFGHPALLWIPSPDSNWISGNLGIYDNCSPVSSLPCSYPPSPLTSVHVPMPPDCIPHSNCTCITFPWLLDTSSDGFPFYHSSHSASHSSVILSRLGLCPDTSSDNSGNSSCQDSRIAVVVPLVTTPPISPTCIVHCAIVPSHFFPPLLSSYLFHHPSFILPSVKTAIP